MFYLMQIFWTSSPEDSISSDPERTVRRRRWCGEESGYTEACNKGQGIIILHIYELLLFFSHQVMSDCDPMDCSPQGSSLHEVPHPRILEQVATFFSRASS